MFATTLLVIPGIIACQGAHDAAEAERIMRRYEEALGGQERVAGITTRAITGTFEYKGVGQHATGQLEMIWKAPNSLAERLEGPMGVVTRSFDGASAWGSHPQTGERQLSSFEIDEMKLEGALYQPLRVQDRYDEPSYEGRMSVDGRDTEVLSARRHDGRDDRFYFDVLTGLPIRLDVWEEGPEAVRSGRSGDFYLAHYELGDYRAIDGVAVPFFIRRNRPNSTMTFRLTEVRNNVTVPDSIFTASSVTASPKTLTP